ncbi:MAG: hypothetical protein GQE15_40975 [Archangiaceae bacterium]|nr:hypothetical protein [Archangiaceae bacterium]
MMAQVENDMSFINDMRRVLFHRGSPPRQSFLSNVPGADQPSTIPANMTEPADAWDYAFKLAPDCLVPSERVLDTSVRVLVVAAADFASLNL